CWNIRINVTAFQNISTDAATCIRTSTRTKTRRERENRSDSSDKCSISRRRRSTSYAYTFILEMDLLESVYRFMYDWMSLYTAPASLSECNSKIRRELYLLCISILTIVCGAHCLLEFIRSICTYYEFDWT